MLNARRCRSVPGTRGCRRALAPFVGSQAFRHIIFNFPDSGHYVHDFDTKVESNRFLIKAVMLQSLKILAPDGQMHFALQDVPVFRAVRVHEIINRLRLVDVVPFRCALGGPPPSRPRGRRDVNRKAPEGTWCAPGGPCGATECF